MYIRLERQSPGRTGWEAMEGTGWWCEDGRLITAARAVDPSHSTPLRRAARSEDLGVALADFG